MGEIELNQALQEAMKTSSIMEIERGLWPSQLLPICDLGCVQETCVDNQSGQMFLVVALSNDNRYGLIQEEWTFEEWLWRWVKGEEIR